MTGDPYSKTLKVMDGYTRDGGYGLLARIDFKTMKILGVNTGDEIELRGKSNTIVKCLPLYPSDEAREIVRLNLWVRNRLGVQIGDTIIVGRKGTVDTPAKSAPPLKGNEKPWEVCPTCGQRGHLTVEVDTDTVKPGRYRTEHNSQRGGYTYYRLRYRFGHYVEGNKTKWHSLGRISTPQKYQLWTLIQDILARYVLMVSKYLGEQWLTKRAWTGDEFEKLWYESKDVSDKIKNALVKKIPNYKANY